jgi:hypothetical protein
MEGVTAGSRGMVTAEIIALKEIVFVTMTIIAIIVVMSMYAATAQAHNRGRIAAATT